MLTLNNRDRQIPHGLRFYIAPLQWHSQPNSSFAAIVAEATAVLQANPIIAAKLGWDLSRAAMEDRVDQFNAQICRNAGWSDYITDTGKALPFIQARSQLSALKAAKAVAAGGETIVEWIASGAEAVAQKHADRRAETCVKCPLNGKGGLERFFTGPVSEAIRRAVGKGKEWKLETKYDEQLNVCEACLCPLRLKIWMPIHTILPRLSPEAMQALHPDCWIRKEQ
jgi:hypothetical protein